MNALNEMNVILINAFAVIYYHLSFLMDNCKLTRVQYSTVTYRYNVLLTLS